IFQNLGQELPKDQAEQQIWQFWVNDVILTDQYEKMGFEGEAITDAEFNALVAPGPVQDPQFKQFFGSYEQLQQQRQYVQQNPQDQQAQDMKFRMDVAEAEYLRIRRLMKLQNLASKGILVTEAAAKYQYQLERSTRDAKVLSINYSSVSDSAVQVTDEDYEQYYEENKARFKQDQKQAVLQYVVIPKTPTADDTASTRKLMEEYKSDFAETEDDSAYAASQTLLQDIEERLFSYEYQALEEFDPFTQERLQEMEVGEVAGPYVRGRRYELIKLSDKSDEKPRVRVRHILIQAQDSAQMAQQAQQAYEQVTENDMEFAQAVMMFSKDEQSKQEGGMLGWLSPRMIGQEAYDQVTALDAGDISEPIRSDYGMHIFKIEDKVEETYQVARLGYFIDIGDRTRDSLIRKATEVMNLVRDEDIALEDAATKAKAGAVRVTQPPLSPDNKRMPGLQGEDAMSNLMRWALDEAEEGDVYEETLEFENAYVVPVVESVSNDDYLPLQAVKDQIKPEVLNKKKAEMIIKELDAAGGSDLEAMKKAYGKGGFITDAKGVQFSADMVRGLGNEPALVGAIFSTEKGKLTKPVEGQRGVYVAKVTAVNPAKVPEGQQLDAYRKQLQQQRRQQFTQMMMEGLKESIGIKDYRYRHGY
ncbi:MAG: peptidylprolyl isomerase, partial [Bacteroidota bacterium]